MAGGTGVLPRRTGARIARNQDKLAAALLSLMQRTAYEDISVSALCREAGVSRNTFYRNFPHKEAVLHYAVDDICLQYQLDGEGFARAGNSAGHFLEFLRAHPGYFDAFRQSGMTLFLARSAAQHACREAVEATPGASAASLRWVSGFLTAGLLQLYEQWREEGYRTPSADIARAVLAYVPALAGPPPAPMKGEQNENEH